jgi:hypothetical protein
MLVNVKTVTILQRKNMNLSPQLSLLVPNFLSAHGLLISSTRRKKSGNHFHELWYQVSPNGPKRELKLYFYTVLYKKTRPKGSVPSPNLLPPNKSKTFYFTRETFSSSSGDDGDFFNFTIEETIKIGEITLGCDRSWLNTCKHCPEKKTFNFSLVV